MRWRVSKAVVALMLVVAACDSESQVTESIWSTPTSITTSRAGSSTRLPTTATAISPETADIGTPSCHDSDMVQPVNTVLAFYSVCDFDVGTELYPVYRRGQTPPTLSQSLMALVAGTTTEEQFFGLSTGFDVVDEADQIEITTEVDANGTARIDFRVAGERWDPGGRASTSAQLLSFLDPLHATVFRYPGVLGLDRSTLCWGESDCDGITSRVQWEASVFVNDGVLTHEGCTPELARWYPEQCTLEGVLAGSAWTAAVVNVAVGDTLEVRAGPGVEYFPVNELAPGATVQVTGESAVATDGGFWRLTGLGWVNAAFLAGPQACDPGPIAIMATEALALARLTPEAAWEVSPDGGVFGPRTTDPEVLARTLGFDCAWQATQNIAGKERLVVAAWTGDRVGMVIQTSDGPTEPYRNDQTVDIMFAAPEGEKLADDSWAVTLPGGGSLILLTKNTGNFGWLAKSWLTEYVFVPDDNSGQAAAGQTTIEKMSIQALRAAGGRNVQVAEPAHGGSLASLYLVAPSGGTLWVTVGPNDSFDPFAHLPRGTVFYDTIDETLVQLIDPAPESFPTSAGAFRCNDFGWAIDAAESEITDTRQFIAGLIREIKCA